jgi:hypothetical protein
MKEREIFRIVVRAIGVALLGFGLADAFGGLLTWLKFQTDHYYSATDRASAGVAYFLSGLVFLLIADILARFIYRSDTSGPWGEG